jgi:hypothetical protein
MTKLSFGKGIAAILLVILAAASGARAQGTFTPPVPLITSISPVSAVPGGAQFTLTVNGANFIIANSAVQWNGVGVVTDVVSTTQLTATVSAALIASAGTASVAVANTGLRPNPITHIPSGFFEFSNVFYFPVGAPLTTVATLVSTATVGNVPESIAVGDFNADNNLDMAVSNFSDSTVSILLGKGTGAFQTPTTIATLAEPEGIAVGDLNGDGKLDLVIGGGSTGLNVALGNGSGGFTVTALTGASGPRNPVLADVNGDGFLDIVVGNAGTPGILVYLGKGDGTFQAPVTLNSTGSVWSVAVADFNGDGHIDIAAANSTTGNIDVYLGDGAGNFATSTPYTALAGAWSIAAGDFTGDGVLDLAVSSNSVSPGAGIVILPGVGNGTFGAPIVVAGTGIYLGLAAGDMSLDGKLDLLAIAGGAGAGFESVQVWTGNGDGTFQIPQPLDFGGAQNGIALGSFTNGTGLSSVSTSADQLISINSPRVDLSPLPFDYGNVNVGVGDPQVITLTNSSASSVTATSITITGTNAADFTETDNCLNNSVAAGHTCTITVTFTPSASGVRTALLSVVDNGFANTQRDNLQGTGVSMPAATPSIGTLAFGSQNLTVTTASLPVTLTNTGGATLTGLAISITGTNSADFAQTNNCTATLAVSASCTVNVTFTPGALGARTASLQFTDNASDSPQSVALTGNGVQVAQQLLYIAAPPATMMAGSTFPTITVGVYTMQGMLITSSNLEIQLVINGPMFHFQTDQLAQNGIATFSVGSPIDQAGQYTITASMGDDNLAPKNRRVVPAGPVGLVSAIATTIVTPQNSSVQMIVRGYPSPTFVGIAHTFTVGVADAFSNPVTTYTGTITLTSTDPFGVLAPSPYTFVSGDMGVHTFTGTLNTVGMQTISATDGQLSGAQTGIVVNPPPQFIVNTLADDAGTALCDGQEACSFRSAINQSNTAGAGVITVDTTQFQGSAPFTATLTNGVLELNSNVSITGPSGSPQMSISGNNASAIFQVDPGAVASISALVLTGGTANNNGGAIFNAGTLTLLNVDVADCHTSGSGGGISNSGTLALTGSQVASSVAAVNGGGIFSSGTLTITNSTLNSDSAGTSGGAIFNSGTLTVNTSTISSNTATANGGGASNSGTAVFYDSTINGNTATGNGGGIDNNGSLSLPQSTVYGNTAADGSAIENEASGTMTLLQCTVNQNDATSQTGGTITNLNGTGGAVTILNSIDAGNTSVGGDCVGCGTQSTFNVFNVPNENLIVFPLGNNGGPTQTVLPEAGSPALGAGSVPLIAGADLPQSFANDQRGSGFPRVVNNMVDLGAVETQPVAAVALELQAPGSAVAGQPFNITVTALTQAQNPATSFADTVHFTSSDPLAQLPADYTFVGADGGAHLFIIALETSGAQSVTVTDVQQPLLTATQTITDAAGAAAAIIAVAGSGQTANPGSTFPIALAAKVTDAFGNLIPAVAVTFTAPTTGASGTFAGGVSTVTVATLTTGVATAPVFTANSTAGQYTVMAGAASQQATIKTSVIRAGAPPLTPASFTLTNGVSPSYTVTANPATLSIVQGQSGTTVLTFTPVGGFTGTVSLSCSGLPADSDCVFVPSQAVMTGNDAVVTVTLTVNTTGTNGQLSQLRPSTHRGPDAPGSNSKLPALFGMLLAIAILGWSTARAKRPRYALAALAMLVVLTGIGLTACTHAHSTMSTTPATVPGTYPVNVTASVGTGGTQTALVMITIVQQ